MTIEASTARSNWPWENVGPGVLVVKLGNTRVRVASTAIAARPVTGPAALKVAAPPRKVRTTSERPTMPLHVIIKAAKIVSRAKA